MKSICSFFFLGIKHQITQHNGNISSEQEIKPLQKHVAELPAWWKEFGLCGGTAHAGECFCSLSNTGLCVKQSPLQYLLLSETTATAKPQMVNANHFFQERQCGKWVVWPPRVPAPFHHSGMVQGFSRIWDYLQGPRITATSRA